MNFAKFLRTRIFIKHLRWLLLNFCENALISEIFERPETYLGTCQTFMTQTFCENNKWLSSKLFSQIRCNRDVWQSLKYAPGKKRTYSNFLCSVFSRIQTQCGEIFRIFPYSVQMWENKDQKNSEYEHFSRSDTFSFSYIAEIGVFSQSLQKRKFQKSYWVGARAIVSLP